MVKREDIEIISEFIHATATAQVPLSPVFAGDLHLIAEQIKQYPHAIPTEGVCPYCREAYLVGHYLPEKRGTVAYVGWRMQVIHWLCSSDEQYLAGYRAIWKCDHCGEIEVR